MPYIPANFPIRFFSLLRFDQPPRIVIKADEEKGEGHFHGMDQVPHFFYLFQRYLLGFLERGKWILGGGGFVDHPHPFVSTGIIFYAYEKI